MKNLIIIGLTAASLAGCGSMTQIAQTGLDVTQAAGYSPAQLNDGVKEVLTMSSQRASDMLGGNGGYSTNSLFKISMPEQFDPVIEPMRALGLGQYVDNIENLMNQGAEQAAEAAAPIFLEAISNMSVDDALGIIRGGNTAATNYFRANTEQTLKEKYQSIMQAQLEQLGFYGDYKTLANSVAMLPIANKPNLDLESYAIDKGMNALFAQIAAEEAKIRANPVEAGSVALAAILGE